MQWVTKIQALQGVDVTVSGGDSEEEITRDLLAAFKFVLFYFMKKSLKETNVSESDGSIRSHAIKG